MRTIPRIEAATLNADTRCGIYVVILRRNWSSGAREKFFSKRIRMSRKRSLMGIFRISLGFESPESNAKEDIVLGAGAAMSSGRRRAGQPAARHAIPAAWAGNSGLARVNPCQACGHIRPIFVLGCKVGLKISRCSCRFPGVGQGNAPLTMADTPKESRRCCIRNFLNSSKLSDGTWTAIFHGIVLMPPC